MTVKSPFEVVFPAIAEYVIDRAPSPMEMAPPWLESLFVMAEWLTVTFAVPAPFTPPPEPTALVVFPAITELVTLRVEMS